MPVLAPGCPAANFLKSGHFQPSEEHLVPGPDTSHKQINKTIVGAVIQKCPHDLLISLQPELQTPHRQEIDCCWLRSRYRRPLSVVNISSSETEIISYNSEIETHPHALNLNFSLFLCKLVLKLPQYISHIGMYSY